MLTLNQLQKESAVWTLANFGIHPAWQPLLGAVEEVGELAHAHLKSVQLIRGSEEEHRAAKIDAVADIIIYLADYCNQEGFDMQTAVEVTWEKVKQRDWRKDPKNGNSKND